MKKNLSVTLIFILTFVGINAQVGNPKGVLHKKEKKCRNANQSITSDWIPYNNTDYGFSFSHPKVWSIEGNPIKVIDLQGNITTIEVNFLDTKLGVSFKVEYHLAPNGKQIFAFEKTQYDSSKGIYATTKNKRLIAGNEAILAYIDITKDGKDNKLAIEKKQIVAHFLNKKQDGEFQLTYEIPTQIYEKQMPLLIQVLNSFQLISK